MDLQSHNQGVADDGTVKYHMYPGMFESTPPLEGLRMLCSKVASRRQGGRKRKMLFLDARKAHLNPKREENVYIELPEEAGAEGGNVAN